MRTRTVHLCNLRQTLPGPGVAGATQLLEHQEQGSLSPVVCRAFHHRGKTVFEFSAPWSPHTLTAQAPLLLTTEQAPVVMQAFLEEMIRGVQEES